MDKPIVDNDAFQAFMLAMHEYGTSAIGIRKCLAAYEAAKQPYKHSEVTDEKGRPMTYWGGNPTKT